MRSARLPTAALLALLVSGCASTLVEQTVSTGSPAGGRLYVPKVYAPLLPGSIYPNRRAPIPARSRPGVVVLSEAPFPKAALDLLLSRGFVVLSSRSVSTGAAREAAAFLAAREETRSAPIALFLVGAPASVAAESVGTPGFAAFVFADLAEGGGAPRSSRPAPSEVRVLVESLATEEARFDPREPLESLGVEATRSVFARVSGKDPRPPEMWREASEWLSEALEHPSRSH